MAQSKLSNCDVQNKFAWRKFVVPILHPSCPIYCMVKKKPLLRNGMGAIQKIKHFKGKHNKNTFYCVSIQKNGAIKLFHF